MWGDEGAATVENYRGGTIFDSDEDAIAYVEGGGLDPSMAAIVRYVHHERFASRRNPIRGKPTPYQRRILGSRAFRREAELNDMTVREWYEAAPNLKAARGHAPTQLPRRYSYALYVRVTSEGFSRQKRAAMRRKARQAWDEPELRRQAAEKAQRAWGERRGDIVTSFLATLRPIDVE